MRETGGEGLRGLAVATIALACLATARITPVASAQSVVSVRAMPASERVEVLVDGQPFTSYLHSESLAVLKKPVLHPIRSADGVEITRSYPLGTRAWERADHPHQIGLWFNYGDVNGLDFWNNSDAVSEERAAMMGTIRHRDVVSTQGGPGRGVLEVTADWEAPDGTVLLVEQTRFVFHAGPGLRAIDRIATLTAGDQAISMKDNKEGVLGLRVRRELEMPAGAALRLTDASGRAMAEPVLHDEGVGGTYRNSEGITGYPDVWGKRARWAALTGAVDGGAVTVAILDHPKNPGYPTYWHARDYGLFAANPLGQRELSDGAEALDFALEAGGGATFRYRIAILSGDVDDTVIEALYEHFVETER